MTTDANPILCLHRSSPATRFSQQCQRRLLPLGAQACSTVSMTWSALGKYLHCFCPRPSRDRASLDYRRRLKSCSLRCVDVCGHMLHVCPPPAFSDCSVLVLYVDPEKRFCLVGVWAWLEIFDSALSLFRTRPAVSAWIWFLESRHLGSKDKHDMAGAVGVGERIVSLPILSLLDRSSGISFLA